MSTRLDDPTLDEKIMSILEQDARISNREIARTLGVSEGFVRKRLKRLLDSGELQLGTLVSSAAIGMTCSALVRFRVAPESISMVASRLAEFDRVRFVGISVGRFDVYALVQTSDRDNLFQLLQVEIDQLPGVSYIDVREIMVVMKYLPNQIRIRSPTDPLPHSQP
jgi:Lrp/AsnC family transcriptional regulator for asnA, asnC and gidA